MFTIFRTLMRRWFVRPVQGLKEPAPSSDAEIESISDQANGLVPYDENLLERARTQWQFGDWVSLIKLERETLQHHPDRAKLVLIAAAGHMQQGNIQAARQFTRLAQDWGCSKKLVSQILIAGVHNSLGRAAAVNGENQRALQHFESAITACVPAGEIRLLTQARLGEQLTQLGLPGSSFRLAPDQLKGTIPRAPTFSVTHRQQSFAITVLAKHAFGDAWATNTVIYGHHGVLTSGHSQYTVFYVDEHTLRIVQRDLSSDEILTHEIQGDYNLREDRNCVSLGIDRVGHLHISYGHRATPLRYRRAIAPNSINSWAGERQMTGTNQDRGAYPIFILPCYGHPLTLFYYDSIHDKGSVRLKTYDELGQTWIDHQSPILSGAEQQFWPSNAFCNPPVVGNDGSLHLSFVWYSHTLGEDDRIKNINVCYARSSDNGLTWIISRNYSNQLHIKQMNTETVSTIANEDNLINQANMALDSHNRPHIVFYSEDLNGIQHHWFDGKDWHKQLISNQRQYFCRLGGDSMQTSISHPQIVIDRNDNAYIIYRNNSRMFATRLAALNYLYRPANTQVLWEKSLGCADPIIDRSRWQRDNILTLLLQYNQQRNHDLGQRPLSCHVALIDICFN